MMNETTPEEDSEDLTDDEIASALPSVGADDLVRRVKELLACPSCGRGRVVQSHALRRRAPNLFLRMGLVCGNGHEERVFFRANWLGR